MKLKYINLSVATALLAMGAVVGCTPDDPDMPSVSYQPADLVAGAAFSVTPDAQNGNIIHYKALVPTNVTPCWVLPNGASSQAREVTLERPFAGTDSLLFGVVTPGGPVYGEWYKYQVELNDFSMLSNPMWSYLAGGVGKTKRWVPVDKSYGVGQTAGPVTYCNPTDVMNDQTNKTDLALNAWTPNWDPGIQSWLIPLEDPYMESYMEFGLDAEKGCTYTVCRKSTDEEQAYTKTGTFSFNIDDEKHPLISFNGGTSLLHQSGFDKAGFPNWTTDLKIVTLTDYCLQVAIWRTADSGDGEWWLIWSFVPEDVRNGIVEIPVEELPIAAEDAKAIEDQNLLENLFTVVTDDATYKEASSVTYLFNEDQPYGFYWWNGASAAWEKEAADNYGQRAYYPEAHGATADFALILNSNGKFEEENSGLAGFYTIDGNTLNFFSDEALTSPAYLTFFTTDQSEFVTNYVEVVKADPNNNEFFFALPESQNAKGVTTKYCYANLAQKSIASAPTGPTVISVLDPEALLEVTWVENNSLRIPINHGGTKSICKDASKLKLKKGQTLKLTFKVEGIKWAEGAKPRCAFCANEFIGTWEPNCFAADYKWAADLNTDGSETTVILTNETDSKADLSGSNEYFDLSLQLSDMIDADAYANYADGGFDNMYQAARADATITVTSLTIE